MSASASAWPAEGGARSEVGPRAHSQDGTAPSPSRGATPTQRSEGSPVNTSPRVVALGLGCDRGTPDETIAQAIDEALAQAGASLTDVAAVASIDLKADEAGLLAVAAHHGWAIVFHPAATLAAVDVPNPSETVRRYTGTPSVSEAAALLAADADLTHLIVEKHKLRGPDGRNATVSIARLPAFASSTATPTTAVHPEPVGGQSQGFDRRSKVNFQMLFTAAGNRSE